MVLPLLYVVVAVLGADAFLLTRRSGERACAEATYRYEKPEFLFPTRWDVTLTACPARVAAGRPVPVRARLSAEVSGSLTGFPTFNADKVHLTVEVTAAGVAPVVRSCPVPAMWERTSYQVDESGEPVRATCDVTLPAGAREPVEVRVGFAADLRDDGLDPLPVGPVQARRDGGRVRCAEEGRPAGCHRP